MLLIGSRAICHHLPEFRKPVDWDLIGNREEQARIASRLPIDPKGSQNEKKTHYLYDKAMVEFAVREELPYWDRMCTIFENEPTIVDPVLGEMHVPPASFLLLTKQAGLIYRIRYWHKNLEDLFFLRNLIPEIPEHIAPLLADAQANSLAVYGKIHELQANEPFACHPQMPPNPRPDIHRALHEVMKFGKRPAISEEGAWQGFPHLSGQERIQRMIVVFAEEVMVLAGHHFLEVNALRRGPCPQVKRFALRAMITSCLPPAWRYFGVNHYREISELIPEEFFDRLEPLEHFRAKNDQNCVAGDLTCDAYA